MNGCERSFDTDVDSEDGSLLRRSRTTRARHASHDARARHNCSCATWCSCTTQLLVHALKSESKMIKRWSANTRLPHGEHSRDRTEMSSSPIRHISLGERRVSYTRAWNSRKFRVRIVHSVISGGERIITSFAESNSATKIPDWRNRFACVAHWGAAGFVVPAICWVD